MQFKKFPQKAFLLPDSVAVNSNLILANLKKNHGDYYNQIDVSNNEKTD